MKNLCSDHTVQKKTRGSREKTRPLAHDLRGPKSKPEVKVVHIYREYYLVLIVDQVWKNLALFALTVRPLLKISWFGLMACGTCTALSHWFHHRSLPTLVVKAQSDVKMTT